MALEFSNQKSPIIQTQTKNTSKKGEKSAVTTYSLSRLLPSQVRARGVQGPAQCLGGPWGSFLVQRPINDMQISSIFRMIGFYLHSSRHIKKLVQKMHLIG